jgi:hypothetical protein
MAIFIHAAVKISNYTILTVLGIVVHLKLQGSLPLLLLFINLQLAALLCKSAASCTPTYYRFGVATRL